MYLVTVLQDLKGRTTCEIMGVRTVYEAFPVSSWKNHRWEFEVHINVISC